MPALRVYPRVCGEARPQHDDDRHVAGLSPRVRGSRADGTDGTDGTGSIPACAGKPVRCTETLFVVGVYPRVCGEALIAHDAEGMAAGLSPRVRGSLRLQDHRPRHDGSIPACAGKPRMWPRWRRRPGVYPRVCGEANEGSSRSVR